MSDTFRRARAGRSAARVAISIPRRNCLLCARFMTRNSMSLGQAARVKLRRRIGSSYLQPALAENEILESIRVPLWPAGTRYGFNEYARRRGDFALAGAAALVVWRSDMTVERLALMLFGVAPQPVRLREIENAMVGRRLDHESIRAIADAAKCIEAMSDPYVSADYRRRLSGIVIERALAAAEKRAEMPA
jgi:carbon-monoxide dehydrogenase medium subunit